MRKGKQEPRWAELPVIHRNAAGLDIGAAEIVACVPQDRCERPIRTFTTYTPDLQALAKWFKECGVETVAMEATGVYWLPIYEVLEKDGFALYLVNPRHLKNVAGRKSDVSDAQWIQTLHSYGLLHGSFIPAESWRALRSYWRQRCSLVEHRAPHIQHMQQAMQRMNLQLTQVLSDVTGVTGMQIMRAIAAGERDAHKLAQFREATCRRSEAEIAQALTGNYRGEHIFALKQALALYDFYTVQIAECDAELDRQYQELLAAEGKKDAPPPPPPTGAKRAAHAKNAPACDVRTHLYRHLGIDLTAVGGLGDNTVQTILAEIGSDMSRWPTAKHFSSWLGLAPHNDISGGKVLRSHTGQQHNRAGQAFRMAAQSNMRSKNAFGAYFRRHEAHIGTAQALVALAHKIARTFYYLLKYRTAYDDSVLVEQQRRYQQRRIRNAYKVLKAAGIEVPLPAEGLPSF